MVQAHQPHRLVRRRRGHGPHRRVGILEPHEQREDEDDVDGGPHDHATYACISADLRVALDTFAALHLRAYHVCRAGFAGRGTPFARGTELHISRRDPDPRRVSVGYPIWARSSSGSSGRGSGVTVAPALAALAERQPQLEELEEVAEAVLQMFSFDSPMRSP